jgi:hypothetical protein
MEPKDNIGSELESGTFLNLDQFERANFPETLLKYEGDGSTSFAAKGKDGKNYDIPKMQYLATLGIETPDEWKDEQGDVKPECRALLVTMFVTTGVILATESIRRTFEGQENDILLQQIIRDRNNQLIEHRLDKYGYRVDLPDGSKVEDHLRALGASANPEKRVSPEELHMIVDKIFDDLSKSEEY